MRTSRIHMLGAGVTTLGRALADALTIPHHDTDDYFWQPTTPPYRERRGRAVAADARNVRGRPDWMLRGSPDGWGDPLMPLLDLVVFLYARVRRLRDREAQRGWAAGP
jgi:hypothetical protein